MKKIYYLIIIITLVRSLYPSSVSARNFDFSIHDSITGQVVYYKYNADRTSVSVVYPGSPYDYWNEEISGHWVHYHKPVGALVIPDYVVYDNTTYPVSAIEDKTFYGCDSLTDVSIGNNVSRIGAAAFYGCSNLHTITVGSGLRNPFNVGRGAFLGCNSLIAPAQNNHLLLKMPTSFQGKYTLQNVKYVCNYAFDQCYGIDTIVIPNGVLGIQSYAFSNCACRVVYLNATNCGVSYVYVYGTGNVYGGYFQYTPLKEVIVGDSVHTIQELFRGCGQLQELTLGKGVVTIARQAFVNCSTLTNIYCRCIQAPQITYYESGTRANYNTFRNVPFATCTLHIPCNGSGYNTDAGWRLFQTQEKYVVYKINALSTDTSRGSAGLVEPPYCMVSSSRAKIQATPHAGYHFARWNDGNIDNPRTIIMTRDTTIYAIFEEGTVGINNPTNQAFPICTTSGRIIVTNVEEERVRIYDMVGRCVSNEALPAGVYMVKIGDYPARKVVVIR